MSTLENLATLQELTEFWRAPEGPDESDRAESLLKTASSYLRQIAKNNRVAIDDKITEEGEVYSDSVKLVIMMAVKRAMVTPLDAPPADQWSQSASPYSATIKFTNPSSDLYFKSAELKLLGFGSTSGNRQFGLLRGVR